VSSNERSLLSFLDAPVLVGDPDGRTVYVNPAFEERFGVDREEACGTPLAQLFEGGGREAMLRAVATVCSDGESIHFRMREQGFGFAAVASPILADQGNVGVLILLKEEVEGGERLIHLHRQLSDAIEELGRTLDEPSGKEERAEAFEKVRQWSGALRRELTGRT
jgi:PAS domain S-box-containing protein